MSVLVNRYISSFPSLFALSSTICHHKRYNSQLPVQSDDGKDNRTTLKKKADEEKKLNFFEVNWEELKRSWRTIIDAAKTNYTRQPAEESIVFGREDHKDKVIYYFRELDDLNYWYVNTDEDIQGYSWAEMVPSSNDETAMFRGRTSNKLPRYMLPSSDPLEPKPLYRGYCYMETKPFKTILDKVEYMNFFEFNAIKIRLRGDGRMYMFGSLCDFGMVDYHMFWAPIFTNGGPEWQEVTIPYSKFYETKDGQKNRRQNRMILDKMMNFQFHLRDGIEGPFQLEIDYIAFARIDGFEENKNEHNNPWLITDRLSG